ncbi:carbamoyltransferase HypF [Methanocaldococcus indicus]|uniref:carbamoyltransferase HypF n=1 Tax=Methanocaldococcus indicus TaxID=213231 RepID=UPI003C6D58C4
MKSVKVIVKGIVQGVGFRPFIYRLAKKLNLKGYVKNLGNVVEIHLEGENIDKFLSLLKKEKPPLAKIEYIEVEKTTPKNFKDFEIIKSSDYSDLGIIPADISICEECLKEIFDKNNKRRYLYPFNSCVDCGPRFTIIYDLPYDRENTSMRDFPLCSECLEEYNNPEDRRFHGETISCKNCGPSLYLTDGNEILAEDYNSILLAKKLLNEGYILAIKGIGGFHLACRVDNDETLIKLRERLNRKTQPFAVMTNFENIKLFAHYDEDEKKALLSKERPIVILDKNEDYHNYFSKYVSNLNTIGVFLPYSGLHYLLLKDEFAFVMTSANLPGLPMVIDESDIEKLKGIADYFLIHNRKIVNRCDDSVVKKIADRIVFLRRSRGYAPEPIDVNIENDKIILCVGAELNSTACLVKKNRFYLTQYIGNTSKYETFLFLKDAIKRLLKLTKTNRIDYVVCDLHPQYNSTKLAYELSKKFNSKLIKVQHHFAHAYSLLGDNNYFDDILIFSLDGMGYGLDGNIWGGEVLLYKDKKMERVAHLEEQIQVGGDLAVKYPIRMLFSILYKAIGEEAKEFLKRYLSEREINILEFQLKKNINCFITTSTGRVLDAISSLLNICQEKTYDGEPAIRLESVAKKYDNLEIKPKIKNNILLTTPLIEECYNMYVNGEDISKIAYFSHMYIADGLFMLAKKYLKDVDTIGLTGGVSYNKIITERIYNLAKSEEYNFIYHRRVPNGDGGISFGQGVYLCLSQLQDIQ